MSTIGKTNFPPGGIDTSDATVVASDMKVGVTAYGAAGTKITGTMTVHASDQTASSITNNTTTLKFLAPAGYYDGSKYITFTDADFAAGNIRVGYNIFGIDGTFTNDATATAGQILATVTAYVNGSKITGTMTNQGAYNITPGTSNQSIPAGYHNGSGVVAGDSDLVAGNIKSGVNIFGVSGTYSPGGNWTTPTLYAGNVTSTSNGIANLNYTGAGVAYIRMNLDNPTHFCPIFFGINLTTNASGAIINIDGITVLDGYNCQLKGYCRQSTGLYTVKKFTEHFPSVTITGPGVLYILSMSSGVATKEVFFGSSAVIDRNGFIYSIDGVYQSSGVAVNGYAN